MDKSPEHHIEFLESGEDAAKAFEAAEQPLDLVAPPVQGAVIVPSGDAVLLGRHDRDEAEGQGQLPGFVALVGAIHEQGDRPCRPAQLAQQLAAFRRIVRLPWRQGERQGGFGVRGNQMNRGGPSAARLADGLRAVFFNAPAPSGWTLTEVLSSDTASILIRTIRTCCKRPKTRSSTPAFDHRFMRV